MKIINISFTNYQNIINQFLKNVQSMEDVINVMFLGEPGIGKTTFLLTALNNIDYSYYSLSLLTTVREYVNGKEVILIEDKPVIVFDEATRIRELSDDYLQFLQNRKISNVNFQNKLLIALGNEEDTNFTIEDLPKVYLERFTIFRIKPTMNEKEQILKNLNIPSEFYEKLLKEGLSPREIHNFWKLRKIFGDSMLKGL